MIHIELNDTEERLRDASQRKVDAGAGETLEEAYSRILTSKNLSDTDKLKIKKVFTALLEGNLTREESAYKKDGTLKRLGKAETLRLYHIIEEEEKQKLLSDLKDNMPKNYILVNTINDFKSLISDLKDREILPIDVETTGTDIWSDYIVGYVVSDVELDNHYYIPTKHKTDEIQLHHDSVTKHLKVLFENKEVLYIGHNIKFDLHMLLNEGIKVSGSLWDSQEVMRLLNENEPSYALKTLATKYLELPSHTYGQLFGKVGFHEVSDLTLATSYAAKDGDITYKLYKFQRDILEKHFPSILKYAETIEMPLIHVVVDMERDGFVIDVDYAEKYGKELEEEISLAENNVKLVLGDINLNSPVQVKEALEKHTKRSLKSTDAKSVLKPLSKEFSVVKELLRYKELTKLYGTYVEKLPKAINEKTGRLMPNFNINGARTGRFSSSGDSGNMQNIAPEAQKLFVAPKGKVWIEADFKAQEIRSVAYLSEEPTLIEAFEDNLDPYAMIASQFFNKPYKDVYKNPDGSDTDERKTMKVVWLATLYGMGAMSLAEMLGISKDKAEELQNDLFASLPTLAKWIQDTQDFVKKHGYVWLDKKQRKRRLPMAKEERVRIPYGKYWDEAYKEQRQHNAEVSKSLRQAPNAIVQGSSSIQTKATLIKAHEVCGQRDGWKVINVIHDAIFWELPEDFTHEDAKVIIDVMTETYPWGDKVRNGTDLEVMKRWSDGVSLEDWFGNK